MTFARMDLDTEASLLASYWGKADPSVGVPGCDHHTVLGHSLDVAACAFILVDENSGLRARLAIASGLPIESVAATMAAICALHDVGKVDTRFQRKAPAVADALRPHTRAIEAGKYDHGTEGFRQIEADEEAAHHAYTLLGRDAMPLLRAVCGHHGGLPTRDEPDPSRIHLPKRVRDEDAAARRSFQTRVVEFFCSRGATFPWPAEVDGPLVQWLAGLCAVSDWLGSNVDYFPYSTGRIDLESYWGGACVRARSACDAAGLLRAVAVAKRFEDLFPGYSPRDVQLLTEQVAAGEPALVIVEAEMGKGKTEAALSLSARFLSNGVVEGITVALPTMATSNAMFGRVEDLVPRLFAQDDVQLALAHGRAAREPRFQSLIRRALRASDVDAPEASVMCARWLLNKKRILLAQVGVGTIDQALQAALVVRHQFVRMFGLARNVVVIDEVHAYDAYMEVLLEHLLAWLGALRVPVVLLSATLPSERRAALARAWLGADPEPADELAVAVGRPYPLVTVTTRAGTQSLSSERTRSTRTLVLEKTALANDVDAIAERLTSAARAGGRVVWIRNTVREAQLAFRAVARRADGVEHILFHARFRGCDRRQIEKVVLERFGKAAPPGGRVLVATQVVEQSLDLDFDELHTDLAPIDLVFQRAGRLHRHQRVRLPWFERPRLIVHAPSDEDLTAFRFGPSKYVYDIGTLWIAERALRSREEIHLPDDIRPLVEESYHPASRAALLPLGGPALVAFEDKRISELEGRRTKAKQCCIPPTSADPDGGSVTPDDEEAVQAFTRDGMSVTVLPFLWTGTEGLALDATPDASPWELNGQSGQAWRLAGELLDQTLSLPARGNVEGLVVAKELVAWNAWRKRFVRFAEESGIGSRLVPLPMTREGEMHKGWLQMGGRRRRVAYTSTHGFIMPSEKDEEEAR